MTTATPTFNILGPLTLHTPTGDHTIPGRMPRTLLAALLTHPDHTPTLDTLIDTLWPQNPPPSAVTNIRTYVSRLRTFLTAHHLPHRLHTRTAAYHLQLHPDDLDLTRFDHLTDQARHHWRNGDATNALTAITNALHLWHGTFLADLPDNTTWHATATRATTRRDALTELATTIQIHTGRTTDAIADLHTAITNDPLHEGHWHNLILALHADGRTTEALAAYSQARTGLRTELGIEPGPRLRKALDTVLGRTDTPHIRQLPIDTPHFTGRHPELTTLTTHLTPTTTRTQPPAITAISGPPGTGKTTLAVHTAHQLADYYPDGQLYIELQGTSDHPTDPATALSDALTALGVPTPNQPKTLPATAALYRSHLATRRILVVLDDAADPTHAAPLLPGTGPSAVIITSRTHLTGIPTTLHLTLQPLTTHDATTLFTTLTNPHHPNPDDTHAVLTHCGHLPLAITIAAARLNRNPTWTTHDLATRLRTERHRLDELRSGDLDVRTSLALSYRHLTPRTASAFRRLGLLGEHTLPAWTATALADPPHPDHPDTDPLETLLDGNLVHPVTDHTTHPRIRLHDLLRCFAREKAAHETPTTRTRAVHRLLDTWLTLTVHAATAMPVPFFGIPLTDPPHPTPLPHPIDDPLTWFDTEHANLTTAVDLAVDHGLDDHAWRIAAATAPYHDLRGRYDAWARTHQRAMTATERSGNHYGHAVLARNLGQAHLYQDRYEPARRAFDTALTVFTDLGDPIGEAVTLSGIGAVHRVTGDHRRALACHDRALALFHGCGDASGEALVSLSIGRIHLADGDRDEAGVRFARALELAAAAGDDHRRAQAMHRLAQVAEDGAEELLDSALRILDGLGDQHCAAYVRQTIGEMRLYNGDIDAGRSLLADSLRVQVSLGDRAAAGRIAALLTGRGPG